MAGGPNSGAAASIQRNPPPVTCHLSSEPCVENNFLRQTHTTALHLTNVVGLVARRNKVIRSLTVADSNKNDVAIVIGAWGSLEAQNCDNVAVRDNVSRKYKGPWKELLGLDRECREQR